MNEYRLTAEGDVERFSGRILRRKGRVYVNPTQEVLGAAGYKPLVRDPIPPDAGAIDGEGKPVAYRTVYSDEGGAIRLSYRREATSGGED